MLSFPPTPWAVADAGALVWLSSPFCINILPLCLLILRGKCKPRMDQNKCQSPRRNVSSCQGVAGVGGWVPWGGLPHPSSPFQRKPLLAHADLESPGRKAAACLRGFPATPSFLGSFLPSPLAGKPEAEGGSSTQLCSPRHFHIMLMHSC